MLRPVQRANIPFGKVKYAIAGEMPQSLNEAFTILGINIVKLTKSTLIQPPVASHADMLCHYLDSEKIFLSNDQGELKKVLDNMGFKTDFINKTLGMEYPDDVLLNGARLGNTLICNKKYIAYDLLVYCKNNGIKIIDVNQGYAKCSVCIINEHAIITEDENIAENCAQNGIDTLLIEKGHVLIEGYDYGFIGGCAGLISPNELAFFGNIERHPDYKDIIGFLRKHNVKAISLTDENLVDIGGYIPLLEEVINRLY